MLTPTSKTPQSKLSHVESIGAEASTQSLGCISQELLLRAGYIRQSSSGIYSYLPLGLRVLSKLEAIIDDEMRQIGGQKLSLPLLLSPAAWILTNRYHTTGPDMFKLNDRKGTGFLLAPTHEEEITSLVASLNVGRKNLPLRLYQVGRKYRDEARPRGGLLRGREFLMKDMYTFDATADDALRTYQDVRQAYNRIFSRIGVRYVAAEADTGNIGGTRSHEYHFLSSVGEDTVLTCESCGYAANEERADGVILSQGHFPTAVVSVSATQRQARNVVLEILKASTQAGVVDELKPFNVTVATIKPESTILDEKEPACNDVPTGRTVYILIPANRRLSELKFGKIPRMKQHTITFSGSAGIELDAEMTAPPEVFIDSALLSSGIDDLKKVNTSVHVGNYTTIEHGDGCPVCFQRGQQQDPQIPQESGGRLTSHSAIEVAHAFYLGTKYSSVLNATVTASNQQAVPMEMGCFGIGVSRILAAVVESSHDQRGIIWPHNIAPYKVCIVCHTTKNEQESVLLSTAAEAAYENLECAVGYDEVVLDDRDLRLGNKIRDAMLIGYPIMVILGKKYVSEGIVEVEVRKTGEKRGTSLDNLAGTVQDILHEGSR
ncbi:hypothetical protein HDU85_003072 [Gaertneriomyces sp. JEL0708]|nr:hypothetical protein HDU85_003072 [Gaertneriomyces sp. JEL0708]